MRILLDVFSEQPTERYESMIERKYCFALGGSASDRNAAEPLPEIPMVRVLDEHDREVARGWYVHHECRQVCPLGDSLKPSDVAHLVAVSEGADWNMPRKLSLLEVTPPHRIEPISSRRLFRSGFDPDELSSNQFMYVNWIGSLVDEARETSYKLAMATLEGVEDDTATLDRDYGLTLMKIIGVAEMAFVAEDFGYSEFDGILAEAAAAIRPPKG